MLDNYIRVGSVTPEIKVADPIYNSKKILECIIKAKEKNISILCFPELSITGYTCGDLFLQKTLLDSAKEALIFLANESKNYDTAVIVGMPFEYFGKIFNAAAVFGKGKIYGIVPKTFIPNYGEFYEMRHFAPATSKNEIITIGGQKTIFGTKILFCPDEDCKFSVEICEDLWVPDSPSVSHAKAGANIIFNLSASNEVVGKAEYRKMLVCMQSAKLMAGYVYASAGIGESTTDMVFMGHNMIYENGHMLSEASFPNDSLIYSEIDLTMLNHERRRVNTFSIDRKNEYEAIFLNISRKTYMLSRWVDPHPFVPKKDEIMHDRCERIITMQSVSLQKRLKHLACKAVVIGVSGGLDSTFALLVIVEAFENLKIDLSGIIAVTMPCFGTTKRTENNALKLCEGLNINLKTIDISEEAKLQLKNIEQSSENQSTVFENVQARIRTLTLMDIANKEHAIVIGTGNMSELSLGWATYNGDHMSMYGINCGVPKTLVKHLVKYISTKKEKIKDVLTDILETPVSPELLPSKEGKIIQKTEEIIGPYELHDFFLYHFLRWSRTPIEIFFLAFYAFDGSFSKEEILKWLKIFYKRFFEGQFKRSATPDGPKIGSVSLSPRGDLRMPSDANFNAWMTEIENIKF